MKQKFLLLGSIFFLVGLLLPVFAVAETSVPGSQPQSYSASSVLQPGTVVQPEDNKSGAVKAALQAEVEKAFGVVVKGNNLPISFRDNSIENQLFVSTSGRQPILVNTEHGVIKSGDLLAVSSLNGTLTKATPDHTYVFGKALTNFDGKNNRVSQVMLRDVNNVPRNQVDVGLIDVNIEIIKNPLKKSTMTNLPEQLQRVGQAIAEKPVSAFRVYIGAAIVFLSIIFALMMLYVGIRSAIISIGRNPLAKKSIFRALLEVILTSTLVLIIGLFAVYLILRL